MALENIQLENTATTPPGIIVPWMGGYFGDVSNGTYTSVEDSSIASANSFLSKYGWAVCDGTETNDSDSYFFNGAGRHVPNLTDSRFLMGGTTAGSFGGSNTMLDHTHAHTISATQAAHRHYHDHASVSSSTTGNHRHSINAWAGSFGAGGTPIPANYSTNSTHYTNYTGNHSHTVDIPGIYSDYQTPSITVTGTVGAGSAASATDNRPKYLTCLYIMKIK